MVYSVMKEITVFYPAQFSNRVSRDNNKYNSYSLFGLGAEFSFYLTPTFALAAEYESSLNANTSSALFSGLSVGFKYFLYGEIPAQSKHPNLESTLVSRHNVVLFVGGGTRHYDFSSIIPQQNETEGIIVDSGETDDTEGDFWTPTVSLGYQYADSWSTTLGTRLQYMSSIKTASGARYTIIELWFHRGWYF